MATTEKRVHIYLNKYESKILEELRNQIGDTQSGIFKKALIVYRDSIKQELESKNLWIPNLTKKNIIED